MESRHPLPLVQILGRRAFGKAMVCPTWPQQLLIAGQQARKSISNFGMILDPGQDAVALISLLNTTSSCG